MGQPELDAQAQRGDLLLLARAAFAHAPGALADDRHLHASDAEETLDHVVVSILSRTTADVATDQRGSRTRAIMTPIAITAATVATPNTAE